MNYLQDGYRGLTLIVNLNWDRVLFVAVLMGALAAGTYLSHP